MYPRSLGPLADDYYSPPAVAVCAAGPRTIYSAVNLRRPLPLARPYSPSPNRMITAPVTTNDQIPGPVTGKLSLTGIALTVLAGVTVGDCGGVWVTVAAGVVGTVVGVFVGDTVTVTAAVGVVTGLLLAVGVALGWWLFPEPMSGSPAYAVLCWMSNATRTPRANIRVLRINFLPFQRGSIDGSRYRPVLAAASRP